MTVWTCAKCPGSPACELNDYDNNGLRPMLCPYDANKRAYWEYYSGPTPCDKPKLGLRALGGVR